MQTPCHPHLTANSIRLLVILALRRNADPKVEEAEYVNITCAVRFCYFLNNFIYDCAKPFSVEVGLQFKEWVVASINRIFLFEKIPTEIKD
jgi:hypothetical protein